MKKSDLSHYFPIARAIEALLSPYAEIVIHDLKTNKIAALFNNISKRKVGADSLLEKELRLDKLPDYFEPYYKVNVDGRKLKSVTSTLKDSQDKAIGLLCINLDISKLEELEQALSFFTHQKTSLLPQELFQDDYREKISFFVHTRIKELGKTVKTLTKDEKKQLVMKLHQDGAFRTKHAASFVGEVLDISRATVYKYLGGK